MSNLPVLALNTLPGLSEEAGALYLRGADRHELKAFRCACCWDDHIAPVLETLAPFAAAVLAGQKPELTGQAEAASHEVVAFLRERHFRSFFPDGRAA